MYRFGRLAHLSPIIGAIDGKELPAIESKVMCTYGTRYWLKNGTFAASSSVTRVAK
jgi:hypothetical protein